MNLSEIINSNRKIFCWLSAQKNDDKATSVQYEPVQTNKLIEICSRKFVNTSNTLESLSTQISLEQHRNGASQENLSPTNKCYAPANAYSKNEKNFSSIFDVHSRPVFKKKASISKRLQIESTVVAENKPNFRIISPDHELQDLSNDFVSIPIPSNFLNESKSNNTERTSIQQSKATNTYQYNSIDSIPLHIARDSNYSPSFTAVDQFKINQTPKLLPISFTSFKLFIENPAEYENDSLYLLWGVINSNILTKLRDIVMKKSKVAYWRLIYKTKTGKLQTRLIAPDQATALNEFYGREGKILFTFSQSNLPGYSYLAIAADQNKYLNFLPIRKLFRYFKRNKSHKKTTKRVKIA